MQHPLVLTREDELQLVAVAESVVKSTMEEYNEHLVVHNGVVDERRWKKIKQRDDVRVYRERSASLDGAMTRVSVVSAISTSHSRGSHSNSSSNELPDSDDIEESLKSLAPMLAFGSIEGSLEDVMYGAISPSTEAMQLKSAYVEDGFVDWAMLASIIKPSEREPFSELSVKRVVKGNSLLVSAVMRPRSALFVESNGIAQTPNGERIGYHLRHSVEIPGVVEQPDVSVVRAKISFCYLFRQRRADSVEVFVRGVIDPMGDAPASLMAFTTAEVTVSVSRNTHCAEMKKLTRILSCQPSAVRALLSSSSSASSSSVSNSSDPPLPSSRDSPHSCALCNKSIRSKFKLPGTSAKEKNCAICALGVCSRCRVYKTLYMPSTTKEKEVTASTRAFCTSCLACVVGAWSATFAVLDARAAQGEPVEYASALSMSKTDSRKLQDIPE